MRFYDYPPRATAMEELLELPPAVVAWAERVEAQPGFMNDLEPYPANARPGAGRSTYDSSA